MLLKVIPELGGHGLPQRALPVEDEPYQEALVQPRVRRIFGTMQDTQRTSGHYLELIRIYMSMLLHGRRDADTPQDGTLYTV